MTKRNSTSSDINNQHKKVGRKKLTTESFIARCKKQYGDLFDYSAVVYQGALINIEVKCCKCSTVFYPTPANHYNSKSGCPSCNKGAKISLTQKDFEIKAVATHGKDYDYSKSIYINSRSKISITCAKHGEFLQLAKAHLQGYGCPECGIEKAKVASVKGGGWTRSNFVRLCENNKATLYVLKCFNDNESFYKVGITSATVKKRYRKNSYLPYDYEVLFEINDEAAHIFNLEYRLHDLLKGAKHEPSIHFRGHTECFTTIKPVEKLLKELSNTDQLQLIA